MYSQLIKKAQGQTENALYKTVTDKLPYSSPLDVSVALLNLFKTQ